MSSSENDCFADYAVEDAVETDTPLSSVSIGEQLLCNLWFADDIDLLGSSEEELQQLTQRLEETINQSKPVTPRRRWGTRQMPPL